MAESRREQLTALLNHTYMELDKCLASLPEAERNAFGTWEQWAPKDFVAHIMYWEGTTLKRLERLDAAPEQDFSDFEELNHRNYLQYQAASFAEIAGQAQRIHTELVSRIQQLSDEDLSTPGRFAAFPGDSVDARVVSNSIVHPITHVAALYQRHGNTAYALRLQEETTDRLLAYDTNPRSRGTTLYNLACALALNGQSQRAIELIREAVPLRPDLLEWSKQDTDLDSLRGLPEFQALYQGIAA